MRDKRSEMGSQGMGSEKFGTVEMGPEEYSSQGPSETKCWCNGQIRMCRYASLRSTKLGKAQRKQNGELFKTPYRSETCRPSRGREGSLRCLKAPSSSPPENNGNRSPAPFLQGDKEKP